MSIKGRHKMPVPGSVTNLVPLEIGGTAYMEYAEYINSIILDIAIKKGQASTNTSFHGATHKYEDDSIRAVYKDSDYGNDRYYVEINTSVWNDLPEDVNPYIVIDDGWVLVYDYLESREKLLFHVNGSWLKILEQYR